MGLMGVVPVWAVEVDPDDQVAPAGLKVNSKSHAPINKFEALTLRQELLNLVGRFESALIASHDRKIPAEFWANQPSELVLTASAGNPVPGISDQLIPEPVEQALPKVEHPALEKARGLLADWPDLMARRDYGLIRQRWLQARQELWQNFPIADPVAQPEVRAVWLDRGTIVKSRHNRRLEEIFDRLAAAGINTVFFETVNAGYPIYPSQVAPEQNPLTKGWDPLAEAIELAHARNMELHAWVWVFAAGNRRHNALLGQPHNYPGPILAANPDWAGYDNKGNLIPPGQGKPFLDPANSQVRSYLLRLLTEIAQNYNVDGVQLDYIRYPFQDPGANRTYGYGKSARQKFKRLTGVDPVNISPRDTHRWKQWTDFRVEQITSLVSVASRLFHRQRSHIKVSAAVFTHSEHERRQKLQQNWETWARKGDLDFIVLMSYAMDTNRLERLTRPWLLENEFSPTLIVPGIRLLNLSNLVAFDQIQALRDFPSGGYALFAFENIDRDFQTLLGQTQGNRQANDPIPYRQPFHTAAVRYKNIQQEWNFLMANQQLRVRLSAAEDWKAQVDAVGRTLDILATDPNARHLTQARRNLDQLQQNLGNSIGFEALNRDYHLRTWEHDLKTIALLLDYGEREILGQVANRQRNLR